MTRPTPSLSAVSSRAARIQPGAPPNLARYFLTREACPVCLSEGAQTLCELPLDQPPLRDYLLAFYSRQGTIDFGYLEGEAYVLQECRECDLIYQRDIPGPELSEILYERWIDPHIALSQHVLPQSLSYHARNAEEIMRLINYFDRAPSSLRFFDFGMGWGEWALMARAFGCDSMGAELSAHRIAHAAERGITAVAWDDIHQLECDVINTEQVFEHIPDPLETLRHLRAALRPGGLLKISVPRARHIKGALHRMDWLAPEGSAHSLNAVAPLEHINCYGRRSLTTLAEAAELQIVALPLRCQYQFMADWSRPRAWARNLLLPLYRRSRSNWNYLLLTRPA